MRIKYYCSNCKGYFWIDNSNICNIYCPYCQVRLLNIDKTY